MIAKSNWFARRKYLGWGLTPQTWQGWVYIILIILPYFFITNLSFIVIWTTIILMDLIHVFLTLKTDERETLHEAIADRNTLWFVFLAITGYIIYQSFSQTIDYKLIYLLAGSVIVKTLTHLYLRDK